MSKVMNHGRRSGDGGYMLVALMGMMAIIMLMMMAAAPVVKHQAQRERELEAIHRGEEVAEAISRYVRFSGGRLPTSMRQLLEGIPYGTKRIHVLRASAAHDPLTPSGEWRLIGISDAALVSFQQSLITYAGRLPETTDPAVRPYAIRLEGIRYAPPAEGNDNEIYADVIGDQPFIGVASQSRSESIIHYYGLNRHNQWVFTPLYR